MLRRLQYSLILMVSVLFFVTACENNPANNKPDSFYKVMANGETDPVPNEGDAADDAAIWVNRETPDNSIIFGTDKKGGIAAYRLSGKEFKYYPVGNVNNIDIRYNFPVDSRNMTDIMVVSNRTTKTFEIYSINMLNGKLMNVSARKFDTKLDPVYGISLYVSPISGKFYVFVNSKDGSIEQWELFRTELQEITIDAKLVRTLKLHSTCEGMVADDNNAVLYVAEENFGIWKFLAEPNAGNEEVLVDDMKNANLKADIEGLTIFQAGPDKGYLIASSQGNHSYAVFERNPPNAYLGSFVIVDGQGIAGTFDSDGIVACNMALGSRYPYGLFISQDGGVANSINKVNQNFKLVDWKDIAESFDPPLLVSPNYDPYKMEEATIEENN